MKTSVVVKLRSLTAILAIAVLISGGCSSQNDAQTNSDGSADGQPVMPQGDTPMALAENQGSGDDDSPHQIADVVYTNGKIYTVDETQP